MSEVGRQAAVEAAAVMVLSGEMNLSKAAELLDIPLSTLHRHVNRFAQDPEATRRIATEAGSVHLAVLHRAAAKVYDGLEHADFDQALKAYSVSSDKAALYLGLGGGGAAIGAEGLSGARSLSLLVQALEGREVTVSVRDLSQDDANGQPKDLK